MESVYENGTVSLTRDIRADLKEITTGWPSDKIFLIFDTNTYRECWPLIRGFRDFGRDNSVILQAGEDHKNISQVIEAWEQLGMKGLDRKSLIINVGGGMLTDLGGFIASTIKRGVEFINIPTTLLAMVDASVGGKCGFNFSGLKNEIGVIREPRHVFIHLPFLRTLDQVELLSGYAEMLKAGLIADNELWDRLKSYPVKDYEEEELGGLVWESVKIKKAIVDADLHESNLRKSLNFGHTIGHALESEALYSGTPVLHGQAVAWGMILEARLSGDKLHFPEQSIREIADTMNRIYGPVPAGLADPDKLIPWMRSDKKNMDNQINFTLLKKIGYCRVNCTATEDEIRELLKMV